LKRYVNSKSENIKDIKITQQDLLDSIDKVKPRKKEAQMTIDKIV
jgi:transitional endoplasmic reticulum ATPase